MTGSGFRLLVLKSVADDLTLLVYLTDRIKVCLDAVSFYIYNMVL